MAGRNGLEAKRRGGTGCVIPHFSTPGVLEACPEGLLPCLGVQDHPAQPTLLMEAEASSPEHSLLQNPANSSSTNYGASRGSTCPPGRTGASPSVGEGIPHLFNPDLPSTTSLLCTVLTILVLPPCIRLILVIQPVVNYIRVICVVAGASAGKHSHEYQG